jgi:hypothetical protein
LKSRCPCGAVYTIKPEFLGKKTLCKNCGRSFLIEALPSPQSSPESSSAEPLEFRPDGSEVLAALESAPVPPAVDPLPALQEPIPAPPELETSPGPSEIVMEELEPLEEIEPAPDPAPGHTPAPEGRVEGPDLAAQGEAGLKGGRRPLVAMAVAAVAGALVGAGLMGLIRQSEIDVLEDRLAAAGRDVQAHSQTRRTLGDLKKELAQVQDEIRLLEGADYPAGSIPRALTAAAILEYGTAEALLRQQVAALESGARLTVSARATAPDPKLAAAVEEEMARLKARLEELRLGVEGLAEEPRSLVQTAIATEELNLAILNRNRLIARYGLSAPLPPQGPAL